MFKAFPLNLTSIQKFPRNPHKPMGIAHSPHTDIHGNRHTHGSPADFTNDYSINNNNFCEDLSRLQFVIC